MPNIKSLIKPQPINMGIRRKMTNAMLSTHPVDASQSRASGRYTNEELEEYKEVFSLFDKVSY